MLLIIKIFMVLLSVGIFFYWIYSAIRSKELVSRLLKLQQEQESYFSDTISQLDSLSESLSNMNQEIYKTHKQFLTRLENENSSLDQISIMVHKYISPYSRYRNLLFKLLINNNLEIKSKNRLTFNQKNYIIPSEKDKIIITHELLYGHTYIWRISTTYRTFALYVYTLKYIAHVKAKPYCNSLIKKFLIAVLHDSNLSGNRKKKLIEHFYYYLNGSFSQTAIDLFLYFKDYL